MAAMDTDGAIEGRQYSREMLGFQQLGVYLPSKPDVPRADCSATVVMFTVSERPASMPGDEDVLPVSMLSALCGVNQV